MVTCPSCGFSENRDNARYCSNCAAPLNPGAPLICPRCNFANTPGARYCSSCGSPLQLAPPAVAITGMLAPSTILQGRYVIVRKLGQGGMSAVYGATDVRIQSKRWAVKEMSDAALADPAQRQTAIAAFQREAQLLATLDHPNLPKVMDYFSEGGKQYLVMDFVEGQTLGDVVADSPGFLAEAAVCGWAEQLCEVLAYLHARTPPIIFRDLKPANIMLTREDKIKLIDFGIARLFKPGQKKDTAAYGTMGYAAPEQFGAGQTDPRSDVYSLGVTLHHLLTKYDPSLTPFNLPPPNNINPAVSPQMQAAIARATKSNPADRFQSTREMRASFSGAAARTAAAARPTSPALPPTLRSPRPVSPPTERLAELMSELTWLQLLAALGGTLVFVAIALRLLSANSQYDPVLGKIDSMAVVPPLAYMLARRRGATFLAFVSFAVIGKVAYFPIRNDGQAIFPIFAVLVGMLLEFSLLPLPRWAPKDRPEKWWVELLWLIGVTAIATLVFDAIFGWLRWAGADLLSSFSIDNLSAWSDTYKDYLSIGLTSLVIGALGWFVGDTLHRTFTLRQTRQARLMN